MNWIGEKMRNQFRGHCVRPSERTGSGTGGRKKSYQFRISDIWHLPAIGLREQEKGCLGGSQPVLMRE